MCCPLAKVAILDEVNNLIQVSVANPLVHQLLMEDEILNLNILGILRSNPDAPIFIDHETHPSGVYVQSNPYFGYLYTQSEAFADLVCETFLTEGYHGFSGVEDRIARYIMAKYRMDWSSPCMLYYLPDGALDLHLKKSETRPLDPKWAKLVDDFYPYKSEQSVQEIEDNLSRRPSAAIFDGDDPVCWLMVHEDYSMGIMHTLDSHRRKGLAVDVTIALCKDLLDRGIRPFLQIVENNHMSPGLALKCGFVPYKPVTWFGVIVGNPDEGE